MIKINMNLTRYIYTLVVFLVCIELGGCAFQKETLPAYFDQTKSANYYLKQAKKNNEAEKIDWIMFAIQALIKENRLADASKLLANLPKTLNLKQNNDKILSVGEIWVKINKPFDLSYLDIANLNLDQRGRYYSLKLVLDKLALNIDAQAHDYVLIEKYVREEDKKQIINNTWLFLNSLNKDQLKSIVVTKEDLVLRGWMDLFSIYDKNRQTYTPKSTDTPNTTAWKKQKQKDQLTQEVYNWSSYYVYHPAQLLVPKLLGVKEFEVSDKSAMKVALLLPLNGASRIFGETIRQGYLDAMNFYPDEKQQNVIVLDTTSQSISSLVSSAQAQGAKVIIGPLLKENVQAIRKLKPSIPVLALNKIDDDNLISSSNNICFLSLSPEDEAKDAARHIYSQRKRKSLLLVPNTDLGKRVAKSFAIEWEMSFEDAAPVYVQYFGDENQLRKNMNSNIGIDLVGERVNPDSSSYINTSETFDSIYIYSSYGELNLIKPMIEMNNNMSQKSSRTPILYTSSLSHIANASTDFYFDMDGIQFADIPLIMDKSSALAKVPVNIRNNYSLMRLYAMGIDAWQLSHRFKQLTTNQLYKFDGMTGKLSTTYECEITRSLVWDRYLSDKKQ